MLNFMILFRASLVKQPSAVTESFEARPRDFVILPTKSQST